MVGGLYLNEIGGEIRSKVDMERLDSSWDLWLSTGKDVNSEDLIRSKHDVARSEGDSGGVFVIIGDLHGGVEGSLVGDYSGPVGAGALILE